jgi:hypothetical protein
MFDEYFEDWEVKQDFMREYISLWPGWLGVKKLHLLDEVNESEWSRFDSFVLDISKKYAVGIADCNAKIVIFPENIATTFCNFSQSQEKTSAEFSNYIIPELNAMMTEEWDYTYIFWYKDSAVVKTLSPFISDSKLHHFSS